MQEEGLVSFIVIAYNEAANVGRCLNAIEGLEGLCNYEVIVVNDASRDDTALIVQSYAATNPHIRLIDLHKNRGRGYARYEGVAASSGSLIATIDADIVVPCDWLLRAKEALTDYDAIGGVPIPDGEVAYLYRRFRLSPRPNNPAASVTGCNALYRRTVFDKVAFDPGLREGEDVALTHAIQRHGMSCATVSDLHALHYESKSFGTSIHWLFQSGRGASRQLIRYRKVRMPDIVAGISVGLSLMSAVAVALGFSGLVFALPVGFVLAASSQHVRTRFETPPNRWHRILCAVAVDAIFLTTYFAGRVVGLAQWTLIKQLRLSSHVQTEDAARTG
jgi:glycosyltransferase involved in cell wall biosynthesis